MAEESVDLCVQKSVNTDEPSGSSNTITKLDSSEISELSIAEWEIKEEPNDDNSEFSINEVEIESIMIKNEEQDVESIMIKNEEQDENDELDPLRSDQEDYLNGKEIAPNILQHQDPSFLQQHDDNQNLMDQWQQSSIPENVNGIPIDICERIFPFFHSPICSRRGRLAEARRAQIFIHQAQSVVLEAISSVYRKMPDALKLENETVSDLSTDEIIVRMCKRIEQFADDALRSFKLELENLIDDDFVTSTESTLIKEEYHEIARANVIPFESRHKRIQLFAEEALRSFKLRLENLIDGDFVTVSTVINKEYRNVIPFELYETINPPGEPDFKIIRKPEEPNGEIRLISLELKILKSTPYKNWKRSQKDWAQKESKNLTIHRDGNYYLYTEKSPIWFSNTDPRPQYMMPTKESPKYLRFIHPYGRYGVMLWVCFHPECSVVKMSMSEMFCHMRDNKHDKYSVFKKSVKQEIQPQRLTRSRLTGTNLNQQAQKRALENSTSLSVDGSQLSIEQKLSAYKKLKVASDMMGLAIGCNGSNLNRAREIENVLSIEIENSNTFNIHGKCDEAVFQAINILEFTKESIKIPVNAVDFIIGKNGNNIHEIKTKSGVISCKINTEHKTQEVSCDIIGRRKNVSMAKELLQDRLATFKEKGKSHLNEFSVNFQTEVRPEYSKNRYLFFSHF